MAHHTHHRVRGLNHRLIPATLDEAQRMVEACQSIIGTSESWVRVERAQRKLANLWPHVERLERQAVAAERVRAETTDGPAGYVVVWSGTIGRDTGLRPSDCVGYGV